MSKKGKKSSQKTTRKPVPTRSAAPAHPAAGKGRSHPHKEGARANLLTIRIAAGLVAALCLAGIIILVVTQPAPYAAGLVAGVVALAFLTGFSIYAVIRPEGIMRWTRRIGRRA